MTSGISISSMICRARAGALPCVAAAAAFFLLAASAMQAQAQKPTAAPPAPASTPAADPDAHSLGLPKGTDNNPKEKVLLEIYKLKEKKDEAAFTELRDKAKKLGATDEELLEAELTFCFRGLLWDRLKEVGARFKDAVPKWTPKPQNPKMLIYKCFVYK